MLLKTIKSAIGYYTLKNFIKYKIYQIKAKKFVSRMPFVFNEVETLEKIAANNYSVSRYGDGEIEICMGGGIYFQEYDARLSRNLREILTDESVENLLVCIAPHVRFSYRLTCRTRNFVYKFFSRRKDSYLGLLNPQKKYGSTYISRPDSFVFEEGQLERYRSLLRKIWENRDVLIITGQGSRFDLIPKLFDNIRSCEYIYGLSEHAFREYDKLLAEIKLHAKDKLVLLSLGPTATVLAYDLAKEGYQAIDLGHLSSCYEIAKSGSRPVKTGY